jgi:hypothetical protein
MDILPFPSLAIICKDNSTVHPFLHIIAVQEKENLIDADSEVKSFNDNGSINTS